MTSLDSSLDSILVQLGDFGRYQSFIFGLICFAVILHSGVHVAYVFTAMDLDYRCEIPECDGINPDFEPPWLKNAVPFSGGHPTKCQQYLYTNHTNQNINYSNCSLNFDTSKTRTCHKFVYKTDENSILRTFDLNCNDNTWKLAMVGTVNNIGQFFGLFISGIISDRFGRKVTLVLSMVFCGLCGIVRTFAPSYIWFLVFEFFDAAFGAGTYACGFIMGVELVGPKKRVLTGTLVSSCYAIGEVFTAGAAWLTHDWRYLIYILNGPPIFLIFYLWIIPESVRWNLSKGRFEEAKKTLLKVAKFNGTTLCDNALEKLQLAEDEELKKGKEKQSLYEVFKSTSLVLRLINCCFCWITCAFLFYGLTLNSVALAGNAYLDFILTALVEIPAYFACAYFVNKIGRKWPLTASFFLTAITCLVFIFIPKDSHYGSLVVYLLGKFGATAAFTIIYVITSELFPTPLRHSLMGVCSTFGRIGSMISPQTPILAQVWEPLPLLMFTIMAVIAGFLTLLFPETLNIKLPDTIEEAISIGKKNKSDTEIHKVKMNSL